MTSSPLEPDDDAPVERSGSYLGSDPVSTKPTVVRTARTVRRVGYSIAIVVMAWLSVPVIVSVISGAYAGQAVDPYTGRQVVEGGTPSECGAWGVELVSRKAAGGIDQDEVAAWSEVCADRHPNVSALLAEAAGE